jgi:hypothetical protein
MGVAMKNQIEKIVDLLHLTGETAESARLSHRPLTAEERDAIAEARREGRQRLSQQMMNQIESEGASRIRHAHKVSYGPFVALLLVGVALFLSSCQSHSRLTQTVDEKTYCAEHPSECSVHASDAAARS